jgi:hypothetical protein
MSPTTKQNEPGRARSPLRAPNVDRSSLPRSASEPGGKGTARPTFSSIARCSDRYTQRT